MLSSSDTETLQVSAATVSGKNKPKPRSLCSTVAVSPLELDPRLSLGLFQCWLAGKPLSKLVEKCEALLTEEDRALLRHLHLGKEDIVRCNLTEFAVIAHHLAHPHTITHGFSLQFPPKLLYQLIFHFYALDPTICRGLLGKKLKPRAAARRTPEDAGQAHHLENRVLANIQHVYEFYLETKDDEVPVVERLCKHFHFPPTLARAYATLLFLLSYRFEASKKRLASWPMDTFHHIADRMVLSWCSAGTIVVDDAGFLQQLRRKPDPDEIPVGAKNRIPQPILKAIIRIGRSLNTNLSSFFADLNEKVFENIPEASVHEYEGLLSSSVQMKSAWAEYFRVIGEAIAILAIPRAMKISSRAD